MNTTHITDLLDQAIAEIEKLGEAVDPAKPTGIAALVLDVARAEIGKGEEGGNNAGPHVAKYKRIADDADEDANRGAWCASFCSWVAIQAYERAGQPLPFRPSHGAKRLGRRLAKAGGKLDAPRPGCVVVWDRGKLQPNGKPSIFGHVGIVERILFSEDGQPSIMYTIEGNVGRYPSRVRRFAHDLSREDKIEMYAAFPEV